MFGAFSRTLLRPIKTGRIHQANAISRQQRQTVELNRPIQEHNDQPRGGSGEIFEGDCQSERSKPSAGSERTANKSYEGRTGRDGRDQKQILRCRVREEAVPIDPAHTDKNERNRRCPRPDPP